MKSSLDVDVAAVASLASLSRLHRARALHVLEEAIASGDKLISWEEFPDGPAIEAARAREHETIAAMQAFATEQGLAFHGRHHVATYRMSTASAGMSPRSETSKAKPSIVFSGASANDKGTYVPRQPKPLISRDGAAGMTFASGRSCGFWNPGPFQE